ncbi:MAG: ATP-binding domain-containing protein [Ruminococcus sp.]|nr:ATP-binding domain-containing protein [Ruminococcus sp.]
MAIMCPEVPIDFEPDSREDFIFDALSKLPDNYYVFHSLTLLQKKRYGISEHEIDFVVFEQTKGILCIEAKAGQIHYCDGAWRYGNGDIIKHNGPFKQASAFSHNLINYIKDCGAGHLLKKCKIMYAVCFPSVSKVKFGHPSMPPDSDYDLILFKESLDDIENSITSLFSLDIEGAVQNTLLSNQDVKTLMEGVLAPKLNLLPIAEIEAEHRNVRFKTMLNEQIALLDYLEEQSTAVISGAAGTGKTLMAIEKAKRSAELHEKVLFLCYNSKLKEHLRQTYPDEYIDYYTIDGFACSLCQTSESDYEKLQEKLLECGVNGTFPYKHVIIDEGQDFGQDKIDDAEIIDLLYDIVYDKNNGSSFYLFYDKNQLVQGRKLPDCIANADCRLTLYRNCRNTENIATSSLRFLGSKKPPKVFERAIRGSSPTLLISTDEAAQIRTINEMIDKYSDAYGNSIVILTCSTVENSLLSSFRDGEYYRYNGKKVLFTTCRKFKGLESDVVILIDVTQKFMLEQEYKNIVYVGTSRARFELCVVTSLSDNEISEVLATENIKKAKNAEKALATLLNTKLLK